MEDGLPFFLSPKICHRPLISGKIYTITILKGRQNEYRQRREK